MPGAWGKMTCHLSFRGACLPVGTGTGGTTSTPTLPESLAREGTFLPLHCGSRRVLGRVRCEGKAALSELDKKRVNRLFPSVTWMACEVLPLFVEQSSLHCSRFRFTRI